MSAAALVAHQFRYDQKTFWRNPASVFFTVLLPIIFLFIFATIFGNDTITIQGHSLKTTTYYVPAILTLAVISATMVSPAISITADRETGVLKRVRGTPLPSWVFIAGRVGNALVISLLMLVVVTVLGRLVYGVSIPGETLPAVVVTLIVGAASFACLGFAMTVIIPSEQAAPAVTNAIALPLYFISGIFIPERRDPRRGAPRRRHLPLPAFLRGLLQCLRPEHDRDRLRMGKPRRRRRLGPRRARDRGAVLPLDAARELSRAGRAAVVFRRDPSRQHRGLRPRAHAARSTTRRLRRSAGAATPTPTAASAGGSRSRSSSSSRAKRATPGSGHVCFAASGIPAVKAAWEAGVEAGGTDDGGPGSRPQYGAGYYSAYLLDPDGHRVEIAVSAQ